MSEMADSTDLPLPPYRIEEAAEKLNASVAAVRAAARRGDLPAFKLGRDWRLLRGPIDKLLRGEAAG
jgi:excisionase family DNA binding protein